MASLQHTQQTAVRTHSREFWIKLVALAAAIALSVGAIVLIVGGSGTSTDSVSIGGPGTGVAHGTPKQELEQVSGARMGIARPGAAAPHAQFSPSTQVARTVVKHHLP
jgi:hypothetical protein